MPLQKATHQCLQHTRRGPAERTLRVHRGPSEWCVRERWRTVLFGAHAPDWFQLEGEANAELVKRGQQRAVWRVQIDDAVYYAKVFEGAGPGDRVKNLVMGRSAEREWRALIRAEACGVPVVKALAVGLVDVELNKAVLITQALPEAVRLTEVWMKRVVKAKLDRRREAAADLIPRVADLFAKAHEAGFLHPDAHPQNVLIDGGESGSPQAVFADVHDAGFRNRPLTLNQGLESLAHLDQFFRRFATKRERLRFLRAYLAKRVSVGRVAPSSGRERDILTRHARLARRQAERLACQRDRRLYRQGKYFATIELGAGWRATLALQLERRHIFPESIVPDRTIEDWCGLLGPIVAPPAITVGEEEGVEVRTSSESERSPEGIRIECAHYDGMASRFLRTLLGNEQGRAFVRCHRQRHRDRKNDLILGYLEHRRYGLVVQTVLIHPDVKTATKDSKRWRTRKEAPPAEVRA